jgi:hypothetical protein
LVAAGQLEKLDWNKRSRDMKKSSMIFSLFVFVAAMMLSGCIFPYWGDEGGGRRGGYHEGYHEGHHEGGERR